MQFSNYQSATLFNNRPIILTYTHLCVCSIAQRLGSKATRGEGKGPSIRKQLCAPDNKTTGFFQQ